MACKNHPEVETGLATCSSCGHNFCGDCVVTLRGLTYCGLCKGEQVRDIYSGTDTTQRDLASIGGRFLAILLDGLIVSAPLVILMFIVGGMQSSRSPYSSGSSPAASLVMILFYVAPVIYEALMLSSRGQTVGKRVMGIKVVTPEGGDITAGQAWGRAILRLVLGCLMGLDLLVAVFRNDRACLHDLGAKTRVINWK